MYVKHAYRSVPARRGFITAPKAEPAASATLSIRVRGTWPSYVGGGLFSTENVLEEAGVNSIRATKEVSVLLTQA